MDSLMLGITAAAMAMAVVMTVVAVRLLRGERRRSAARIAALEQAAFDDVDVLGEEDEADTPMAANVRFSAADTFDAFRDDQPGAMFAATDEPTAPGRRWLALAAVAVVMAALASGTYVILRPEALSAWTGSASQAEAAPASAPSAATRESAASPQTQPIELLSLKHTIDSGTFTLVGLVDNPIDARPLSHVIAVVYLFDKDGAYFATGKADLAFTGLRPGEESPFTIKVPNVGRIGKYRVGFRRDDGSVIAHVDKRGTRAGTMTEGQ